MDNTHAFGGMSGWADRQAPEIKVTGRRFADMASDLRLSTNFWVALSASLKNDPARRSYWSAYLRLSGKPPAWRRDPEERDETLLDLGEASIYMRYEATDTPWTTFERAWLCRLT